MKHECTFNKLYTELRNLLDYRLFAQLAMKMAIEDELWLSDHLIVAINNNILSEISSQLKEKLKELWSTVICLSSSTEDFTNSLPVH